MSAAKRVHNSINKVSVRMYCIGTGDCFVLKFFHNDHDKFTMMIDCGSCVGDKEHFTPYIKDLLEHVKKDGESVIDLLVITHEHQDHVNGFAKCKDLFENISVKEAWFAWTEDPEDPDDLIKELKTKRAEMRTAFRHSIEEIKKRNQIQKNTANNSYYRQAVLESANAFINGLDTLAEINVDAIPVDGDGEKESLAGMRIIKDMLKRKGISVKYLKPGETKELKGADGVKVYVLGPPYERSSIFKDGKEGRDVFKRKLLFDNNLFVDNALKSAGIGVPESELPFDKKYTFSDRDNFSLDPSENLLYAEIKNEYNSEKSEWRKIDDDWLSGAGSLALRLNSHINNTSLALAIELPETREVILFPGDAEFGSWESWHGIKKWNNKGKDGKHLVEQLLNNTIFYKVGHHLSYNGTALEKGIEMMTNENLAAFATLDLTRIASLWKRTMPNKFLLEELITRCQGKVFIMNEDDITNKPSKVADLRSLKGRYSEQKISGTRNILYKEYIISTD